MNMNKIELSIIIPVYRVSIELLCRCLNSVKKLFELKKEVILVFDGSYSDFCKNYKLNQLLRKTDFNITVCEMKHQGVSASRNYGISKACGEWIFFLDADDYINEEKMVQAFSLVRRNPSFDLVLMDYSIIRNKKSKRHFYSGNKVKRIENNVFIKDVLRPQTGAGFVWGRFLKRKWINRRNLLFDPQLIVAEDAEFMLRVALNNPKILYIPLECYNYCCNLDSAVRRYQKNYAAQYIRSMEQIRYDLEKSNNMNKMKNDYDSCVLYHLLLITVNDSFHPENKRSGREKIDNLKKMLNKDIFKQSMENVHLCNFSTSRKIALLCIKLRLFRLVQCIAMVRHWQLRH